MDRSDLPAATRRSGGLAGGSLLALAIVGGVVVGTLYGQPTIGFLTGFGLGLALFLTFWLLGRRSDL